MGRNESLAILSQHFAQLYYRTQELTRKEKSLLDSGTVNGWRAAGWRLPRVPGSVLELGA
jgi:hypothetical protein